MKPEEGETGSGTGGSMPRMSTKLDAKDVPKLPKNHASLKGKVFDDWLLIAFTVKLQQAGFTGIWDRGYTAPSPSDKDAYAKYSIKADLFLRSHLVTATLGTNAYAFMDPEKEDGLEMLNSLLDIYQGDKHDVNDEQPL